MLSMTVVLIAILAKQWISQYRLRVGTNVESNRAWAWRHRAFHKGLENFHFTEVISVLPLLTHLSLFGFFTGLSIYLVPLNRTLAFTVGAGVGIATLGYLVLFTIVPIVRGDCPMSTPIVDHFQHFGYRVLRRLGWAGRYVARKLVSWLSTSDSDMPTCRKSRDLGTYLEDRLLGGSHGPKLSADTLSWMLQYFRDYDEKAVALEAICALNVYRHRELFTSDSLDLVRHTISRRDTVLASRPPTSVLPVERAYILRAALFSQIANRKESDGTTSQLKAIDSCTSDDDGYSTPLLRAALIGTPGVMMESLVSFTTKPDGLETLISMDKPGLALWSACATERLIPEHAIKSPDEGLTLDYLAVLLCAIIQASLPDEDEHHLGAIRTTPLASLARADEVTYDVILVRRITARAAHLIGYKDGENIFRDTGDDSWAFAALLVWLQAGERMKDIGVRQRLYDSILAKLANIGDPFGDTPHFLASEVVYFATQHFVAWQWSYDALVGALTLFLHQHRQFSSQNSGWSSWDTILRPTCFVLAHLRNIQREASRDLRSRIADLILILGNRRSSREHFVIENETNGSVLTGRISLLHRPVADSDATVQPNTQSTSAALASSSSLPSIWSSACAILSVDHDRLLARVATRLAADLCSDTLFGDSHRGKAPELLRELLSSGRMMKLVLHPDGQSIASNAAKISPTEWNDVAAKLRAMEQVDRQAVTNLITTVVVERAPVGPRLAAGFIDRMRIRARRPDMPDEEKATPPEGPVQVDVSQQS